MTKGIDGQFCGVVIDAHADPSWVPAHVINAMRSHFALLLIREIVHPHSLRLSFPVPLATSILEIPHLFLFLAIHGNHRLTPPLKLLTLTVDVLELAIPIRMGGALLGLAQSLQAVSQLLLP